MQHVASVIGQICLKSSPEELALSWSVYPRLENPFMFRAGLLIATLLPFMCAAQTTAPSSAAPLPAAQATVNPTSPVEEVRLGDSVIPLVGPWRFHIGDDPAWAQPGFDDYSWSEMDMTPPTSRLHPGQTLPLPGWTARGYPD